jgi:hypothetical protein
VAGVSGCRRYALQGSISIVVVHFGEQSGCSMEGEIEAKEQAENRRRWRAKFDGGARKTLRF